MCSNSDYIKEILNKLNVKQNSELYKYYLDYGGFDNNSNKFDEVFDINELYENNELDNYWEYKYPDIKELQFKKTLNYKSNENDE